MQSSTCQIRPASLDNFGYSLISSADHKMGCAQTHEQAKAPGLKVRGSNSKREGSL